MNTGDTLKRVPGLEAIVTPNGDAVAINTVRGESTLTAFGNARVEYRNPSMGTAEFTPMKKGSLPAGFT